MAVAARMTAEEYFVATDGDRWTQLIDGEIVVNTPNRRHQRIAADLLVELVNWCRGAPGRGEAGLPGDLTIDQFNVYAPDLWWASEENRGSPGALRHETIPEIVIEVLSPSTRRYDLGRKRKGYEAAGATEMWIVDPATNTVTIFSRSVGSPAFDQRVELTVGDELTSPLLPGFEMSLAVLLNG